MTRRRRPTISYGISPRRFADWWEENSKEAYNTGLAGASAAFDNYAKSKSGRRKGPRMGIPRFKSKRNASLTCRFTTGTIHIEPDGRNITLPRIGTIRLHEHRADLRALADAGNMRILSATVRLDQGRWFVSLQVEEKRQPAKVARPDASVGVDLGIKTLAVLADSDGVLATEPNPRHLDRAQKQLRRASRVVSRRQGPDRRTGRQASKRWEKANRARNKVHHRVANLREDTLHRHPTASTPAPQGPSVPARALRASCAPVSGCSRVVRSAAQVWSRGCAHRAAGQEGAPARTSTLPVSR
ncbi:RNA-guided endonuclease TnpB family protein [Streptomyces sp. NBC_01221]|uniref:RNA-guided endonuclease TnpB family protein n=1 Tax=unclassified Streptomyces TaxID=2593676 RepID=UPI00224EB358|nr:MULTISPECIES: RNA-guided endonuclease TnpB family protein [unclassified Streptomyces]WSP57276.1 RNA-guided endonuclease TnpB family protein [Streptomyces sp. NBC_01241]MCX4789093.1 RNA-guided endonuclease TnpB family protein [Streptomyces sp. NBC_01221]MCX4795161.1 RNA-guided endonuclease TnpB family protein [Streptomyces sp. NBC_01242]WSJ36463.1 RNA-guided endonuclease TnpB family protein [Streptomyces sp. NBC_01321]WSP62897.1 RNA-guided endonuclease TnpB family protein [Streptomyces sp. N